MLVSESFYLSMRLKCWLEGAKQLVDWSSMALYYLTDEKKKDNISLHIFWHLVLTWAAFLIKVYIFWNTPTDAGAKFQTFTEHGRSGDLTSVMKPGDDYSAASSGCDHEACLDDGDDGQTLSLSYYVSYNKKKYGRVHTFSYTKVKCFTF